MKQMQVTNLTLTFIYMSLFLHIKLPTISRHDSNISYLLQSIQISRIRKHNLYMKRENNNSLCVCVCVHTRTYSYECWVSRNKQHHHTEES